MAKLSAHGIELGRVTYRTSVKAYFPDGKILKNSGFGWKLHARVKVGVSPLAAYENAKEKRSKFLSDKPAYRAYLSELHSMAGVCKRWKLHAAVELMHDDVDGVWSEACDGYGDNVSASVDEVANLCHLYVQALDEMREMKNQAVEA